MQNNCGVLITKPQSPKHVSAFSFNSIGYLFIDLLRSTIEKFALYVTLKATTRKIFKIMEFADTFLFYIYQ